MPKTKVEVYDKDQLIYPFIESDHVTFSNGMKVSEMLDQSISMPTVTHEDLSFKVGVGDQDVSSAIVDSPVAEMTIKGKTYQNILPEPSTHVLINNKEMFKVNEGLDPNVEIVDGVSKSAILSGNTLVNLVKKTTINVESNQNDLWININKLYGGNLPKGKYILLYNIKKASSSAFRCTPRINLSDGTALYEGYENYNTTSGIKKWIFNATAEITDVYFWINTNTEPILIEDFILLEYQQGMENWDIPYFTGMQSVKMPVLTTIGKNLLPPVKNTWYPCRFKQGTTFKLSTKDSVPSNGGNVVFKDINGTSIWFGIDSGSTTSTKVLPCDVYYISNSLATGVEHQLEIGKQVTSYEPYKSNILHTPEEVVLSKVNDAIDTLNLNTGEYVKRVKEIVLDGSEPNSDFEFKNLTESSQTVRIDYIGVHDAIMVSRNKINCDRFLVTYDDVNDYEHVRNGGEAYRNIIFYINKNRLSELTLNGFKQWLSQNPVRLQYELATPIVKTVDLSSSGNWEKVVLDGSERWESRTEGTKYAYTVTNVFDSEGANGFCDTFKFIARGSSNSQQEECVTSANTNNSLSLFTNNESLSSIEKLKEYLQSNPITVWYQTATTLDSTQVKQPIFFKDGHIQLSSGVDNSLIPTLDYQAKTSNSYVMDLMKPSTVYTMKAKSVSGTFTLDGTSFILSTNSAITTPSTLTSKFLVVKGSMQEMMFLEGNVYSKTIPYFKGIKSAFEGEDKIEVLSTGKNLFDGAFEKGVIDVNGNLGHSPSAIRTVNYISVKPNTSYHINLLNLEPFESLRVVYVHEYDENFKVLGETLVDNRNAYTLKSATKFIKINTHTAHDLPVDSKMIVCENSTLDKQYEPYKSNSTKIPLLSPLHSLPNGIYDELIIDRENNKAKIIQRVGKVMFDGSSDEVMWLNSGWTNGDYVACYWDVKRMNQLNKKFGVTNMVCDKFPTVSGSIVVPGGVVTGEGVWGENGSSVIYISLNKTKLTELSANGFRRWASQNPITVYYELEAPVITEVNLEGFPYIYKDGYIFLNSEIVPTTEIIYSINQCQQISASNEDIIRHEKELTYLQKLIAQYVQVDYESVLLSLKV